AITYAQHDDRIRRVEDTDGDGKADQSYVLANGFNRLEDGTGAGVLARGDDIFYTNIPKLWKLVDKDDNGVADERIVLSDGYGVRVAFRGHDMHGLILGPDGRLYFSIGDRGYHVTTDDGRVLANPESGAVFRCELDGSGLEVFATGLRNPQELAFNDHGDLFSVDNNSDSGDRARVVHLLQGGDSGWRMHYQYLPDRGPFNREKIWEPFHAEQPAYIVPPVANFTDGPSGLAYYPGTGFGDQLRDTFLICDFRGGPANSGILSFKLEPQGATYRFLEDASSDPIWMVLATDVAFGPEGALYVSDWVDGWEGLGKGRIYRIFDPQHVGTPIVKQVQRLLVGDWSKHSLEDLAAYLSHVDRRVRLEAQWELASRGKAETLVEVAKNEDVDVLGRLHAVWGIDQIARLDADRRAELLQEARVLLESSEGLLRAAAAKLAGERGDIDAKKQLRTLLSDPQRRVQYFAAMALAGLKDAEALPQVVKLLQANDNRDPALRHAGVMYLASVSDQGKVANLKSHPSVSVRRAAVVALRRSRYGGIGDFLQDKDPLVAREAARAIHDAPIPVAMGTLAEMITNRSKDAELTRRVLNANFRLGTEEAAQKLAEFAGDPAMSPEMRVEALEMLAKWSVPGPLDRVLGSYRPLEPRPSRVATAALEPQVDNLMTANGVVREKAIDVAAQLGIKKIVPMLIKRVGDTEQTAELRANALQALSRLDLKKATEIARSIKMLPATALLRSALQVLAQHDSKGSLAKFVEATQSRDMRIRQLGWDILGRIDDPKAKAAVAKGMRSYLEGSLPADVHLNVREAANGKLDEALTEAVAEHDRSLAEADSLGPWLMTLEGGDENRGRQVFFNKTEVSCLRCHQVDRAGGEVGPELTMIGKQRDRRYLLEAICLPNAQIAKGFETAMIVNDSGQVFTGIVKSEDDDHVELIQNDGSQQRILVEEIINRRKGRSSMPDDLVKQLSSRELRDLVAYLASLQTDPRREDDTE
ncbi:MAG: HEAT repeat domain-containing protein, partial [Pirellulales bacterium]|nr:HEAT repeat domain-containing protein [Pirellulales bacterium]